MSVFNKVLVILGAAFVLAGAIVTILAALDAISPDIAVYGPLGLGRAREASGLAVVGIVAVSIIIGFAMAAIIALEFLQRPAQKPIVLDDLPEGFSMIDASVLQELAEREASTVRDVTGVTCEIEERPYGLAIQCRVLAALASNIPQMAAEIQNRVRSAVQSFTGLAVQEINVGARYRFEEFKRVQ